MHKRCWRAEMAAPTIVMLVSHDTTIQGGGLPWITFLVMPSPSRYGRKREGHPGIDLLCNNHYCYVLFCKR